MARVDPDIETPVNPYSLLEAVNSSSDTSHTGWLLFLAVMTYLVIAVAGVTHEALLLETPVQLPILQVKIQLKQFFQFAPIVLVLFHLGIMAQLVLLARKTLEFDHAIRLLETSSRRTHPLRLELHNFFFVQAIAGPQRSVVMSGFLNIMSWLTIVILPVILLLYMQVAFLPYHDVTTTWINRIALLFDIVLRADDRRIPDAAGAILLSGSLALDRCASLGLDRDYGGAGARRLPVAVCGDRAGRDARPRQPPLGGRQRDRRGKPRPADRVRAAVPLRALRRHAVRRLPPQHHRHRFRSRRREQARRRRQAPEAARPRPALRQARPHGYARRRPHRRGSRRREPRRRQSRGRLAHLRRDGPAVCSPTTARRESALRRRTSTSRAPSSPTRICRASICATPSSTRPSSKAPISATPRSSARAFPARTWRKPT